MYVIGKRFDFAAAHSLPQLPKSHKCHRVHGHNYVVSIVLGARGLDVSSFVTDYDNLKSAKEYIDGQLDHHNLNDLFDFPTTAENLAEYLYRLFLEDKTWGQYLHTVVVQETPKTFAAYSHLYQPIVFV